MTSTTQNETSKGAQGAPTTVSVYDFIYHDARRVASFLSQFDNSGHLTQITKAARISRVRQETDTTHGTLGIISGDMNTSASDEHGKESQRVYDPTWANARVLLDYLDEASRIQRDASKAQIGQFVLASGSLEISDLQLMEKTWRLEGIKKLMLEGVTGTQKPPVIPKGKRNDPHLLLAKQQYDDTLKSMQTLAGLFFELITILPHTIQARLNGDVPVWCSLSREGMTFDASDIVLKFGDCIPGTWHILGVLDALPDDKAAPKPPSPWDEVGAHSVAKMMEAIAPVTRNLLGRPAQFYGVTPLMIFRDVED